MKIAILSPMKLPIPSIKGGAIETIIDQIRKVNSNLTSNSIDYYSIYDKNLLVENCNINNKIIYIKANIIILFIQKLYNCIVKIINKIFTTSIDLKDSHYKIILKYCIKNRYDAIIFEGGNYYYAKKFLSYYKKSQLILHLHHNFSENQSYTKYFGKIICVSKYVCDNFKHRDLGISKTYILKNVVDKDEFYNKVFTNKDVSNLRIKLNFCQNDFVLLYCGRIIKEKGIYELVNAFNLLKYNDLKLLIIGSSNFGIKKITNFEKQIIKLCEKNENILYLGYIPNNNLYKYYKSSNLFVSPSNCEEAAGLVNIESALCGLPIISTKMGGIPEYINNDVCYFVDNKNNFINNLKNAIDFCYHNRFDLEIKKQNCNKYFKESSINNYFDQLIQILMD